LCQTANWGCLTDAFDPSPQANDLAVFRADTKCTIRALRKAGEDTKSLDPEVYCLRGLEEYFKSGGTKERKQQIARLVNGILEEQWRQREIGVFDPLLLSTLASACSQPSKHKALILGTKDAKEARLVQDPASRAYRTAVEEEEKEEKLVLPYRTFQATMKLRKRINQSSARSA